FRISSLIGRALGFPSTATSVVIVIVPAATARADRRHPITHAITPTGAAPPRDGTSWLRPWRAKSRPHHGHGNRARRHVTVRLRTAPAGPQCERRCGGGRNYPEHTGARPPRGAPPLPRPPPLPPPAGGGPGPLS